MRILLRFCDADADADAEPAAGDWIGLSVLLSAFGWTLCEAGATILVNDGHSNIAGIRKPSI